MRKLGVSRRIIEFQQIFVYNKNKGAREMTTPDNQVILEEVNDLPNEQEIIEFAKYLGINPKEVRLPPKEPELMWIAKQGMMARLPKGWKAILDQQGELYYFNFDTGESKWDHPCDDYYKSLVVHERKLLNEGGKNGYKPEFKHSNSI